MIDFRKNLSDLDSNLINNVFQVLPSMGIVLDHELNIVATNDKFYELFELSENVIGKHYSEFFDNYTFINAIDNFYKGSEQSTNFNHRILIKKEYLHFKINLTKIEANKRFLFIWCEDQTKHVKQKIELDSMKYQVANSKKMTLIGEMTSGIAQEFSSPLMIISNSVKQLSRSINEDAIYKNGVLTKLEFINRSIGKLISLSKNMELYTKSNENESINTTFVSDIINQSLELCEERLKSSNINLIIDYIDPELNLDCKISQLTQTILNLVNITEKNVSNRENKWIKVSAFENGEYVRFSITGSQSIDETKVFEENPAALLARETITTHYGHFYIENENNNHSFIFDIPKGLMNSSL